MFVTLLISPSYLNEILAGHSNLGCRFFLSSLEVCPAIPFWLEELLLKDQLLSLWELQDIIKSDDTEKTTTQIMVPSKDLIQI